MIALLCCFEDDVLEVRAGFSHYDSPRIKFTRIRAASVVPALMLRSPATALAEIESHPAVGLEYNSRVVHPTATIGQKVSLGENVRIDAFAVIDEGAEIANDVHIALRGDGANSNLAGRIDVEETAECEQLVHLRN